jgi:hypothetical protein
MPKIQRIANVLGFPTGGVEDLQHAGAILKGGTEKSCLICFS